MRAIFAFIPDAHAATPFWYGARRFVDFPGPFTRWKVTAIKKWNKNTILRMIFILFDFDHYM
jgi:hypothetical protein